MFSMKNFFYSTSVFCTSFYDNVFFAVYIIISISSLFSSLYLYISYSIKKEISSKLILENRSIEDVKMGIIVSTKSIISLDFISDDIKAVYIAYYIDIAYELLTATSLANKAILIATKEYSLVNNFGSKSKSIKSITLFALALKSAADLFLKKTLSLQELTLANFDDIINSSNISDSINVMNAKEALDYALYTANDAYSTVSEYSMSGDIFDSTSKAVNSFYDAFAIAYASDLTKKM